MPAYPASMSALPQPILVPGHWQPLRVAAAVLCFVAMVLTVIALFVPLFSGRLSTDLSFGTPASVEMTYTPWAVEYNDPELNVGPSDAPRVGYPMVFAVVALAAGSCACWYAATPYASRAARRAAGVVTATAGAFVIGTAWTIALLVANRVDTILMFGTVSQGIATDASYLVGYWLLLVATFMGFAAAVLSLLPARKPVWDAQAPPFGFTPAGGRRMASMAFSGPPTGAVAYAVDPLTGQPVPGPPVAPHTTVDPLTGEPIQPAREPGGQPLTPPDPWPAQPSPATAIPAAQPQLVDPLTGQPIPRPVPFTPEPVPPHSNGAPIHLPDAPPPEPPRGPAVPASEDPLAEPPRG